MQLSREDASLFFKLMPALQTFANQQFKIIKGLKDVEGYKTISDGQRVKLRNAVYENPEVIDTFVRKNPFFFSQGGNRYCFQLEKLRCRQFLYRTTDKKICSVYLQRRCIRRSGACATSSSCPGWSAPARLCKYSLVAFQRQNHL